MITKYLSITHTKKPQFSQMQMQVGYNKSKALLPELMPPGHWPEVIDQQALRTTPKVLYH